MERFELNLSFIACLLSFSLLSQPASAAVTANQATASIDWGTLSLNYIFGGSASTSNEATEVFVNLFDSVGSIDSDMDGSPNWTDTSVAQIDYTDTDFSSAHSSATGSVTELTSFSELASSVEARITANGLKKATISNNTNGILLISANYSLLSEVTDSMLYEGFASLEFKVEVDGSGNEKTFLASANVFTGVGGGESSSSDSGVLALAIPVEAGDILNLYARTYSEVKSNNNPVPLPPAAWLFGPALLMLVKYRVR